MVAAVSETPTQSQIYFNPSCSKCSAVSILDEHGHDAEVVRYLDQPPTREDLRQLMGLLNVDDPRLMMRTGEPLYAELGLAGREGDALLRAITEHPILLRVCAPAPHETSGRGGGLG